MVDIHPEHARSVLESLAIGVVLIDKNQHVNWVNEYTSTLLKRPAEDLLGRAIADLDLPYAPPEASGEPMEVRIDGAMLGITQRYEHAGGAGAVLLLLDRGHALVWFLSTLAGGVPGAVASSGVLARAAIQHRLDSEISRSRRYQNELTCISVRCPGAEGATGVARLLKEQLRWVDLLGQWSDDTLLVVLPETALDAAEGLRDKLAALLAAPGLGAIDCGVTAWLKGDNAERMVARAMASAPEGSTRREAQVHYLEVVGDGDRLP
ncbi:MAG: PAS domain-containing protein [Gammaproteobacteria bacterium]|nr:PAS domain-containing protein [Gammaproteobacteria bacterium]